VKYCGLLIYDTSTHFTPNYMDSKRTLQMPNTSLFYYVMFHSSTSKKCVWNFTWRNVTNWETWRPWGR